MDDLKLGETAKMATQPQQPPQLHLAELTAAQFIDIWKHFDVDGQCAQVSACLMTVELAIGSICGVEISAYKRILCPARVENLLCVKKKNSATVKCSKKSAESVQ